MEICSICQRFHEDSALCSEASRSTLSENLEINSNPVPGYALGALLEETENVAVFRARQIASGHSCRVKIISAANADRDKFRRDADIAAALFHPNIVDIYEAGFLDGGEMFVVFEDPEGQTLRQLMDSVGTPEMMTSVEIIRQTAEALDAIHQSGLVHRAVNPRNVILTRDVGGRPLVRIQNIDLGGVIERSIIRDKFSIDSHLESLRYFAPEQCSGEGGSTRSDVYSLGIVFYELLTGAPPFDAANATALIHKQKNQHPPDVRIDNFDLRMLVTHALSESLQKRPSARQSSVNLFARQLRHIEQLATHSSTPPPAGTVTTSSTRPQTQPQNQPGLSDNLPTFRAPTVPPAAMNISKNVTHPAQVEVQTLEDPVLDRTNAVIEGIEAPVATAAGEAPSKEIQIKVEPREKIEREPRRSRLKVWKKKFHELSETVKRRAASETLSLLQPPADDVHNASELEARATTIESAAKPRRKVEWDQLEDDIPSVAEIQQVIAEEGLPEMVEPVIVDSRVVEPSFAEKNLEQPTISTSEPPKESKAVQNPPVHVEPRSEPVAGKPKRGVVSPQQEKKVEKAVPTAPNALKIPLTTPARHDRDRFMVDVRPVIRGLAARKASSSKSAAGVTTIPANSQTNLIDAEEITIVRARPKPIRVDVDKPAGSRPSRRTEPSFVPTMLGGSADRVASEVPAGGMFSNFVPTSVGYAGRGRSVLLVVGIVGLLALFLLGSDSLSRLFQAPSSAETVASTEPEASVISAPSEPIRRTEPIKEVAERTSASDPKPTAVKSVLPAPTKSEKDNAAPDTKERKTDVERASPKKEAQAIKSTKPAAVEKRPVKSNGSSSVATTVAGQTRPRIVKTGNR